MTETREHILPKPLADSQKDWIMGWYRVFQSLPLAIILLSLLAIGVMVGVFMPQEGLVETAQIKAQVGSQYRLFKAMGLFNVYSSPWFLTIEILFFFNLLLGSFQWLRPAFRAATQHTFCGPEHIGPSPNKMVLETQAPVGTVIQILTHTLKKQRYTLHASPDTKEHTFRWYGHKGDWSRLGPVVAHFGILVMLLASVYGVFSGFKGQQMMSPGDTASFLTLDKFTPNIGQPYWIGSKPDWQMQLHDFNIDYYAADPTTPKQYTSDLELLDKDGNSLVRQDVSVNHPLSYKGVMFYQASFAPTGRLFFEVEGKPVTSTINTTFQDRPIALTPIGHANDNRSLMVFPFFVKQDPGVEKNHVRVFLHEGDHLWGAQAGTMPPNLTLYEGDTKTLGPVTIKYIRPEIATGFQIKKAPETPWIYGGFLLIGLGTAICFMTQRQLWVAVECVDGVTATIWVEYKTHKAPVGFYNELKSMQDKLLLALSARVITPVSVYHRPKKRSQKQREAIVDQYLMKHRSSVVNSTQQQHPMQGATPYVV